MMAGAVISICTAPLAKSCLDPMRCSPPFRSVEIAAMLEFQTTLGRGLLLASLFAVGAQGADSDPTIAIQPLTKYVLPDKTASVMLPDGWRVTQTGVAYIRAEGPRGELAMFGVTVPAHDTDGNDAPPPAPLSQPYSADAGDKLNRSIGWVRAANHQSPVRVIKIYSKESFSAPAEFGSCSKMTATLGVAGGVLDAEADLCSMPVDKEGNYTNFLKLVAISPALAKSERGTLEAVLASFVLNMKAVQKQAAQPAAQPAKTPAAAPSGGMSANPLTPKGRQSLQQQIDAEIKQGGFSPQMVAAMRAQANASAMATMGPAIRQMRAANQAIDYFDRSVLRDQIPVSIANQGTFWVDTN
jgi:hypothetical protein